MKNQTLEKSNVSFEDVTLEQIESAKTRKRVNTLSKLIDFLKSEKLQNEIKSRIAKDIHTLAFDVTSILSDSQTDKVYLHTQKFNALRDDKDLLKSLNIESIAVLEKKSYYQYAKLAIIF